MEDGNDSGKFDNLLEDYEEDLLPIGTKVFPSRYHRSPEFWKVVCLGGAFGFLSFLIGVSVQSSTVRTSFVLTALGAFGFISVYAHVSNKNEYKAYLKKTEKGSWHEGVVVFSSGDVVIRSAEDVFTRTEVELEASTIVSVKEYYAWSILAQLRHLWCSGICCAPCCTGNAQHSNGLREGKPYLYLAFEVEHPGTGNVTTRFFSCAHLVNDPREIVECINETKERQQRRQSI